MCVVNAGDGCVYVRDGCVLCCGRVFVVMLGTVVCCYARDRCVVLRQRRVCVMLGTDVCCYAGDGCLLCWGRVCFFMPGGGCVVLWC